MVGRSLHIADAQSGAFLSGGSAIVEDYRGTAPAFLVTPSAPAKAGDVLVIYCAGLGVTNPPVADGVASPAAQTQAPVTVTIGGRSANVAFAGLTPTLVGLYQVNVTMPAGVSDAGQCGAANADCRGSDRPGGDRCRAVSWSYGGKCLETNNVTRC